MLAHHVAEEHGDSATGIGSVPVNSDRRGGGANIVKFEFRAVVFNRELVLIRQAENRILQQALKVTI